MPRPSRLPALIASALAVSAALIGAGAPGALLAGDSPPSPDARPNLLLAIADDWGWPHASAYDEPVVKTPTFDRLARDGVLFRHAYVSSPSCTPCRGALLTGQFHWRLRGAANLWSVFPDEFRTYPELLEEAGYVTGSSGKAWGPGRPETAGRQLAGRRYRSFGDFLKARPDGRPFCFWLGSSDPHRPYRAGSGAESGMDLAKVRVPACFPDDPEVRSDVADYFWEVQRFDRLVGSALAALERSGDLDRTLVMVTGDHGMPFPRCKSNLYDTGTRVPLVAWWPGRVPGGRVVDDFVSLNDLAPTFLEAAGADPHPAMTGRSLLPILTRPGHGLIDPRRDHVLFGKERHVPGQEGTDSGGYPCRAIRTADFLYIRNYRPDRWPAGTPHPERAHVPGAWLADCDNGPTKMVMVERRDRDAVHRRLHDLAFARRPAEELYDLRRDPDQLVNVAADEAYRESKERLAKRLTDALRRTRDPREVGGGEAFDAFPYLGGVPKLPKRPAGKAPGG